MDDWVAAEQMDLNRLELPKKETKTPVKMMNGSRPSSPEREVVSIFVDGSCLLCVFSAKNFLMICDQIFSCFYFKLLIMFILCVSEKFAN